MIFILAFYLFTTLKPALAQQINEPQAQNTSTNSSPSANSTPINLIANPSLELSNNNMPNDWSTNSWGNNNATFQYQNNGINGSMGVSTTITEYTNGDAKWMHSSIPVIAGNTYTYSDFSQSNSMTELDVAYTLADGSMKFVYLLSIPASENWSNNTVSFTVPQNVIRASMYHIIYSVGTLRIDNTSIVNNAPTEPTEPTDPTNPTEPSQDNMIANYSFEQISNNLPVSWEHGSWGNNQANFELIENDAKTGSKSAKVSISNYVDGDAKWYFSPINTLKPNKTYQLSAWYKTNTQPQMVVNYTDTAGNANYLELPTPLTNNKSQSEWTHYIASINTPSNAVNMTVFFLIKSNGWLQMDDFSLVSHNTIGFDEPLISLTFDDGWKNIYTNGLPLLKKYNMPSTQYLVSSKLNSPDYMTNSMVRKFKSLGHEIGSHTLTHSDLSLLTKNQLTNELKQSQLILRRRFGSDVANNLASPYGGYNTTSLTEIKKYYRSHRSVDTGYNTKDNFDPYNIVVQNINTNTAPEEVASWVEHAKQTKSWLVIVYHNVNDSTNPNDYAVSVSKLEKELQIIKDSGVKVKTVSTALDEIGKSL